MTSIGRGLVAGAVGTLLLDATTYLDMALTGRPASTTPGETVRRSADAVGLQVPADDSRLEAYGALGGMSVGFALGVVSSLVRSAGVRLPAPLGAAAIGGLAMAAADTGMVANGVTDPREWTAADWARDLVPHLAYGVGVRWTMDRMDGRAEEAALSDHGTVPSRRGTLGRSAALGLATGLRNTLPVGGLLGSRGRRSTLVAAGLVGAELVADKTPVVPSRLQPGPLGGRVAGGALGGGAVARRRGSGATLTAVAGLTGAAAACVGALTGTVWRDVAARRGWTWQAALAEDATALTLAASAFR